MADKVRSDAIYTQVYPPNYRGDLRFQGHARSVSSKNIEGNFDVLPLHENFVTLISDSIVIYDTYGERIEIEVGKAVLEATNNQVKVFIEF